MAYTVKQISKLSGVSIRTLHYYEEIDLLKPAYYRSNGYRYYEEPQLIQLQQILFFKELGFTLKQIQKIVGRSDFDQMAALHAHRRSLTQEREKLARLIKTIDQTIDHLKGEKTMEHREFFDGFSLVTKATKGDPYFRSEELVLKSLKHPKRGALDESERRQIADKANALYGKVTDCLEKGMVPSSKEVQALINEHYAFAGEFHTLTNEVYQALAELYRDHPEYRKQLDPIHPQLADFMSKAMKLYTNKTKN